jgi:two-component system, cell cycle sensor histidine kinase and response regulator CckA
MTQTERSGMAAGSRSPETQVLEQHELLRIVAMHVRELIDIRDLDGRRVYVSPSLERFYGRIPESPFECAHPDDLQAARTWWQQIVAGAVNPLEWRNRSQPEGDWRWLETSGELVAYLGRPHVLAISRDITDRKVAEAVWRAAEERLRLTFEAAKIGTGEMDLQTQTINLSEPMQRVVGLPPGTSTLSFEDWTGRVIHPEDKDSVQRAVERGLAGEPHIALDYRIVWRDGTIRWATSRATVLYDGEGKPTRILGAIMDITDRKRLEEELRQAQKMEAVGHLAGGVAHDFNNLLTIISGSTEILLGRLPAGDPLRDLVSEIRQASNRAADLTQQLLAFSRRTVLAPKVLDLNEAVRDSEKLLRRLIAEDVEIRTVLAPELDPVKVDPVQLGQVIMNLAVNARDAMPTGGTLTIESISGDSAGASSAKFDATHGRYVVLRISDTGIGMTPEVRARLFEPFFTTKDRGKGTGLGLAMVYGIVKQSGGFISVDSEPGRGTTFHICLPVAEERLPSNTPASVQEPVTSSTETILLVEDEPAVRSIVSTILQQSGYTVLEADGGRAAIELVRAHAEPIDLLITDVVMPEMGGRQLVEHLTAARPQMKVLYLSGHTDDALLRHGVLEADVAFLQKPFKIRALMDKVREVLATDP